MDIVAVYTIKSGIDIFMQFVSQNTIDLLIIFFQFYTLNHTRNHPISGWGLLVKILT
jgi:hypothetical protein